MPWSRARAAAAARAESSSESEEKSEELRDRYDALVELSRRAVVLVVEASGSSCVCCRRRPELQEVDDETGPTYATRSL